MPTPSKLAVCTCIGPRKLAEEKGGVLVCDSCNEIVGHPAAELVAARWDPRFKRLEQGLARLLKAEAGRHKAAASEPEDDSVPLHIGQVARILGISQAKIRQDAPSFGGFKLASGGPKSHWRFRPDVVRAIRDGKGLPGRGRGAMNAPAAELVLVTFRAEVEERLVELTGVRR